MKKILILALGMLLAYPMMAQVKVPFTQRTSIYSPTKKIYNIKGDFQMIGNTNLTLVSYGDNKNNSNNMKYVDIDDDSNTLNSSSATLSFSTENGAQPACSNIIYAGLYWTGRADNGGTGQMEFDITTKRTNGNTFNGYTLSITSADDNSTYTSDGAYQRRVATYTFTPQGGGNSVIFRYYSWRTWLLAFGGQVTIQVGSGNQTNIPGSLTSTNDNNYTFTFTDSYQINSTIIINSLTKRRTDNTINTDLFASTTKKFNKRQVKLKKAGQTYETITANANDIYYPMTDDGQMYSAYAEVTDYVKANGIGEYFVADMALREGDGGNTGYYGGWGMIVVYENSKMKWRDVTIFDGHAYVAGSTTVSYELGVSGFNTAQNGPINMKLGLIAGEGDTDITGDYFQIQKLNTANWETLSHTGNATNNFFNGSIPSTASRNPNLKNNTGIDIAMFDITNTDNSIIGNNQTSTKFRYGSTQDTYIISAIAMAVDAYVPDLVPYINITNVNGSAFGSGNNSVLPGNEIEYTVEIKNEGTEAINNALVKIPIPYNATFVSASKTDYLGTSSSAPTLITGTPDYINWSISNIPLPANKASVMAKLTFKLKATTDCFLLVNNNCAPTIAVEGTASGTGATSGTSVQNIRFVKGFNDGVCSDEPILGPIPIGINATDYVNNNCGGMGNPAYATRTFDYCKPATGNLPFYDIANLFPAGTRFYSAITTYTDPNTNMTYVEPAESATEYTAMNSFPPTIATTTYYAIPPGASTCWWEFKIRVTNCNFWMGNTSTTNGTSWSLASN